MKLRLGLLIAAVLLITSGGSVARGDTFCVELRAAGPRAVCVPLP